MFGAATLGGTPVVLNVGNLTFAPVFQHDPGPRRGTEARTSANHTSGHMSSCLAWRSWDISRPIFIGPCGTSRQRLRRNTPTQAAPRDPEYFPGGVNPGIQVSLGYQPNRLELVARGASPCSPWPLADLPRWSPSQYIWSFPTGHLTWTPHPQPNPSIPHPLSPWAVVSLTGGHPLPGTMPQWSPGTWPPLDDRFLHQWWGASFPVPIRLSPYIIPNPNNAHLPQIDWNVTKDPSTARLLTANHVIVQLNSVWEQSVTDGGERKIVATCEVGHMTTLWGPITVDKSQGETRAVTIRDLFNAIYQYFRVPLTQAEVAKLCELHPSNYYRLADAYHRRCRESDALEGWEAIHGLRRADALGDCKYWWGVWITTRNGTWWLNLGLINPAHRMPTNSGR